MALDLSNLTPETADLLLELSDLLDGDIDNPKTADAIRELAKIGASILSVALTGKYGVLGSWGATLATKAILDLAEKFIKDKTANAV